LAAENWSGLRLFIVCCFDAKNAVMNTNMLDNGNLFVPNRALATVFTLIFCAVVSNTTVSAQNQFEPKTLKAIKASTVYIKHSEASGSGFFVSDDGVIASNLHVVTPTTTGTNGQENWTRLTNLTVVVNSGEDDEKSYPARLLDFSTNTDLALLKIDCKTSPLPLGDATELLETQDLWAFGFPLGRDAGLRENPEISVNHGAVTSLRKDEQSKTLSAIQTDIALNHGNSGGPVVNTKGEVVGIVVAGREDAQAINYLIPVNTLSDFLKEKRGAYQGTSGEIDLADLALVRLGKDDDGAFELMKQCVYWQPSWAYNYLLNNPVFDGLRSHKDYNELTRSSFHAEVVYGFFNDDLILVNKSGHPMTTVVVFVSYVEDGVVHRSRSNVEYLWNPGEQIKMVNFASLRKDGQFVTQFTIHIISDQWISSWRWDGAPDSSSKTTLVKPSNPTDETLYSLGLGNAMWDDGSWQTESAYLSPPHISTSSNKKDTHTFVWRTVRYDVNGCWFYALHSSKSRFHDATLTMTATDSGGQTKSASNYLGPWASGAITKLYFPVGPSTNYSFRVQSGKFDETLQP
jgi:S1-C subfamily serine protease